MRINTPTLARTLLPVAVGAGCMIVLLCIVNGIAATTKTAPASGDIVSFQPASVITAGGDVRLAVRRASDQQDCVLDLGTMRQTGGSLVVESEVGRVANTFQVHWAGERTATDADDCGGNATLILRAHDLDMLALSAGGYGVAEKQLPISASNFNK